MSDMHGKILHWGKVDDIGYLVGALGENKVFISSTDTIYGFLGNASSESYDTVIKLKQTQERRPFLILIGSIEKIGFFVDEASVSDRIKRLLSACWPGPLTVIFKAKEGLPRHLVSDQGTIALRCPDHKGLLGILPHFDGLFSTSANRSKMPPPATYADLDPELLQEVAGVVCDEEEGALAVPSSIIDLSQVDCAEKGFVVVREGAYSIDKLKELYEKSK